MLQENVLDEEACFLRHFARGASVEQSMLFTALHGSITVEKSMLIPEDFPGYGTGALFQHRSLSSTRGSCRRIAGQRELLLGLCGVGAPDQVHAPLVALITAPELDAAVIAGVDPVLADGAQRVVGGL